MLPTPSIQLSVALVTRNRPESLELCLESLRAQSVQPHEVIISDDSDPHFESTIRDIAHKWRGIYVPGPRKGLYANRNCAALACSGTHIRTMDDDHRLPQDHFKICLESVQADPKSIWTIGEISYVNDVYYTSTETANQLHASGVGCVVDDPDDNWSIADGSTIYPATIFQAGHRFVEHYVYGSSYLEFGIYLYHHGYKSRCLRGTLVEHRDDAASLLRGSDLKVIESHLFSSLCYNLYFRQNKTLAAKYVLACIEQSKLNPKFLSQIPLSFERARARWTGSSK